MSTINWNEALPSANSAVGRSPSEIRSLWSSVAVGLHGTDGPLYWDGSGGGSELSRGTPRPGGFRTYYDVQSNASYSGLDAVGRLYFASDTTRLLTFTSTGTYLVGTRHFIEAEHVLSGTTTACLRQTGSYATTTAGVHTITFDKAFDLVPTVDVSTSSATAVAAVVSVSTTAFTSMVSQYGVAGVSVTVYWAATGYVSGDV